MCGELELAMDETPFHFVKTQLTAIEAFIKRRPIGRSTGRLIQPPTRGFRVDQYPSLNFL
jgi:hypothetical protein